MNILRITTLWTPFEFYVESASPSHWHELVGVSGEWYVAIGVEQTEHELVGPSQEQHILQGCSE